MDQAMEEVSWSLFNEWCAHFHLTREEEEEAQSKGSGKARPIRTRRDAEAYARTLQAKATNGK